MKKYLTIINWLLSNYYNFLFLISILIFIIIIGIFSQNFIQTLYIIIAAFSLLSVLIFTSVIFISNPFRGFLLLIFFISSPIWLYIGMKNSSYISACMLFLIICGILYNYTAYFSIFIERDMLIQAILIFTIVALFDLFLGIINNNQLNYVIGDYYQLIEFILAFYVTTVLVNNEHKLFYLLKLVLISVLIGTLWRISCYFTGYGPDMYKFSLNGIHLYRITCPWLETYVSIILITLFIFLDKIKIKFLFMVIITILLTFIIFSLARGTWLAVFISCLLLFIKVDFRKRIKILFWLILSILIIFLFSNIILTYLGFHISLIDIIYDRLIYTIYQLKNSNSLNSMTRELEFQVIIRDWLKSPFTFLFGQGFGATYMGVTGESWAPQWAPKHYTHTFLLQLILRSGLIGLLAYIMVAFSFLISTYKLYNKVSNPIYKGLSLGMFCAYIGLIVSSFGANFLLTHPMTIVLGVSMGIVYNMNYIIKTGNKPYFQNRNFIRA